MQANRLHDLTGCGHGEVVSMLGWYLGQRTLCAGGLLVATPRLEGFLPFLDFSATFGCHDENVLCNALSFII
jgi:hypothetical protein